jgi:hypothetical protein
MEVSLGKSQQHTAVKYLTKMVAGHGQLFILSWLIQWSDKKENQLLQDRQSDQT